uniref:Uncharacterized protein n=1 Tax=Cyprinodon variegatus TaxID=28743 RepID=A0A3Q2D3I1_CYPVA
MKQSLGELMRMSRICRMLFATCLGSFILVIFYFQSMFQPVMQKNPFVVDGCCRKGSRNSLQDLYSPSQVGNQTPTHNSCILPLQLIFKKYFKVSSFEIFGLIK